jgi:hypothetical protein
VTSFHLRDHALASKDKLKWKLAKGTALTVADLGTPAGDTDYMLCVYDSVSQSTQLVIELLVPPSASAWKCKGSKCSYKDKGGAQDGVQQVKVAAGSAGRGKAQLKGRGSGLPIPGPDSVAAYFAADDSVVVQLVNDTGTCWTSSFTGTHIRKNTADLFKAKAKN